MAITPDGRVFAPIFVGQVSDDPLEIAQLAAQPDTTFHPEYIMSHSGAWQDPFTNERIGGVQDRFGVTSSWSADTAHQFAGFNEAGEPINPDGTPRDPFRINENIIRTLPGMSPLDREAFPPYGINVGEWFVDEDEDSPTFGETIPTPGSYLEIAAGMPRSTIQADASYATYQAASQEVIDALMAKGIDQSVAVAVAVAVEPDGPDGPDGPDLFDEPGTAQAWALKHFPWAKDLNLGAMISAAVTEGIDNDVLIAQVRDTPQYLATFPGITDEQGRMRFVNEQAYVDQVREYRNVLIDAGSIGDREIFNPSTENPVDYATLMERGISTDELQNRLDTYRDLTNNSAHVRATFKIYANMDVSIDDLYQAVVDPEASRTLVGRYNENLLNANFDYSNWVANATEAALEATAETLSILEAQGALPEGAVATINALTDQQAQGLVEALYLGDRNNDDPLLELDELIEAFQFALIGGAAAEQGLVAPSMARVGAFRQAGITRATALKGYGAYVNQGPMIESMLSRTNIQGEGAATFGLEEFENAVFLSQAPEVDLITRARQGEMARGRAPGGFATTARGARLAQPGRKGTGVRY